MTFEIGNHVEILSNYSLNKDRPYFSIITDIYKTKNGSLYLLKDINLWFTEKELKHV